MLRILSVLAFACFTSAAAAQDMPMAMGGMEPAEKGSTMQMGSTQMGGAQMAPMAMHGDLGAYPMTREASGTSWQPQAAPVQGIMLMNGGWMTMLEGRVLGVFDNQSGPRGDSDSFATGMVMAMASRDFGARDTLGLHAMLSLDPFMGRRGYPLLLQTGETGNGITPLLDRQHPHDLFMELAADWSHRLSQDNSIFIYGGYPGDPALGPSVYMHRLSGEDIPSTPLSHHWLDSTHVTFGVVTAGFIHDRWKLEVSQFTGREPDQHRFNFDAARFDSTSARLTFNPGPHWSLQISEGFLHSPEQLAPLINETRLTASATYYRDFAFGSIAATLAYGHKHLTGGVSEGAGLAEAEFNPTPLWTLFARAETIQSDELVPGGSVRRAGEVSLGAIRDWRLAPHYKIGLGGLHAFAFAPAAAPAFPAASYGADPHGDMVFVRLLAQ